MFPGFSGKKKATTTEKSQEREPLWLIEDFPLARHEVFKKAAAECGIIKHLQIPSPLPIMASATALSLASADPTLKTSPFITAGRDPAGTAGACCLSTGHLIFSKHLLNPLSGRPGTMGARPQPNTGIPIPVLPGAGDAGPCVAMGTGGGLSQSRVLETTIIPASIFMEKVTCNTIEQRIILKIFSTRDRGTRSFSSSKQAMKYIIDPKTHPKPPKVTLFFIHPTSSEPTFSTGMTAHLDLCCSGDLTYCSGDTIQPQT